MNEIGIEREIWLSPKDSENSLLSEDAMKRTIQQRIVLLIFVPKHEV